MRGLSAAVRKLDRDTLCARCDERGVPAGPILDVSEILSDPHITHRGVVQRDPHPVLGEFPGLGLPFKFDGQDDPEVARPPLLGEHTAQVLSKRLGMSEAEIAALTAKGVI